MTDIYVITSPSQKRFRSVDTKAGFDKWIAMYQHTVENGVHNGDGWGEIRMNVITKEGRLIAVVYKGRVD